MSLLNQAKARGRMIFRHEGVRPFERGQAPMRQACTLRGNLPHVGVNDGLVVEGRIPHMRLLSGVAFGTVDQNAFWLDL